KGQRSRNIFQIASHSGAKAFFEITNGNSPIPRSVPANCQVIVGREFVLALSEVHKLEVTIVVQDGDCFGLATESGVGGGIAQDEAKRAVVFRNAVVQQRDDNRLARLP